MTRFIGIMWCAVACGGLVVAEERTNTALRQRLAALHWQLADSARDVEHDSIKAAHHYLAAGKVHQELGDEQGVVDAMRAACGLASLAVQTFVHDSPVRATAVTPDQKKLITCASQTATVWSLATGKILARWEHTGDVTGVIVHATEPIAAVNSYDGVTVWDMKSNEAIAQFNPNPSSIRGPVWETRFLSASRQVLVRHREHVYRWDPDRDQHVFSLDHWANGMAFSSEENELLTWGRKGFARIWDLESGKQLEEFPHPARVEQAKFLDDGRILTYALDEPREYTSTGYLWLRNSKQPQRKLTAGHGTNCLAVDRNGEFALSAGTSNLMTSDVFLWSLNDGSKRATLSHEEKISQALFTSTHPNRYGSEQVPLAITHTRETLKVWDLKDMRLRHVVKPQGGIKSVQVSPDGRWLAALSRENVAHLYAVPDSLVRSPLLAWRQTLVHGDAIRGVSFLPDNSRVMTWSDDGLVRIWNLCAGQPIDLAADLTPRAIGRPPYVRWAGKNHVWAVRNGVTQLWNTQRSKRVHQWPAENKVAGVFVDSNATFLAWGDNQVQFWRTEQEQPTATWVLNANVRGVVNVAAAKKIIAWTTDQICIGTFGNDEPAKTIDLRAIRTVLVLAGKRVVALSKLGGIYEIDTDSGQSRLLAQTKIQGDRFLLSRDEQRIATWDVRGRFAVTSLQEPIQSEMHSFPATRDMEVSADCKHVLMTELTMRKGWLYSLEDGKLIKQFHQDGVTDRELLHIKFVGADRIMSWGSVGYSNRYRLRIWKIADLSRPTVEHFLPGLPKWVIPQPDGVLVAHIGQSALTLSTQTARVLRICRQHRFGLNQALFSVNSAQMFTTNPSGQLWRWDMHAEDPALLNEFRHELEVASGVMIGPNAIYGPRPSAASALEP